MDVSGFGPTFLVACLGGGLGELLKWYKLRESPSLPEYARSPVYWGLTLAMILAGGLLAVLYGTDGQNGLLVAQIGLSAPLIVRVLADSGLPAPAPVPAVGASPEERKPPPPRTSARPQTPTRPDSSTRPSPPMGASPDPRPQAVRRAREAAAGASPARIRDFLAGR